MTGVLQWKDKDSLERTGVGFALFVRDQLKCRALCVAINEKPTERLWVWIKERMSKGDIIVTVCYRPPD